MQRAPSSVADGEGAAAEGVGAGMAAGGLPVARAAVEEDPSLLCGNTSGAARSHSATASTESSNAATERIRGPFTKPRATPQKENGTA